LKIPKPSLFFMLFIFPLISSPLVIAQFLPLSPPLNVTVFTNQQTYCLRQPVNIHGNLTLNGPVSDGLVALHVDRPGPTLNPIIIRTLNTGTNPSDTWPIEITKVITCRDWQCQEETDRFKVGTRYAYFGATVKSNADTILTPLLTINIYDGNMVPIGTLWQQLPPIAPGGNGGMWASIEIPSWAYIGNGIIYANVYTDWPFLGGTPYCPEVSRTFKITNLAEITSDNTIPTPASINGTYSMNFRLSPEPTIGQYTIYVSSEYGGEKTTAETTFEVKSASYSPTASFDYYVSKSDTPHKPYPGGTVTFDASSSTPDGGNITGYQWKFGDGQIGSGKKVTHSYGQPTTFPVTLTVTDSEGFTCTTSRLLKVWSPYGPKANFTYKPSQPYSGKTTTFNASISQPGWNGTQYPNIISYKWNFGDGNITTTTNPAIPHIYNTSGIYTIKLNITDALGNWNATSQVVQVDPYPPQASFTYYVEGSVTPDKPYVNGTVTFDASASTPNGGAITNYTWNFGDGTPKVNETDPITYHAYTAAGNYTATLNITDSEGLWSNTSKPVQVWSPYGPKANFTYKPSQPIENGTTIFNASKSTVGWNGTQYPSITSYKWNFGDGNVTTVTGPVIRHVYRENITYTVTLNITDAAGRWNATSAQITVIELAAGHSLNMSVTLVPSTPAPNVYKGWMVSVTVLVINNGTFTETFDVTAYCNTTSLGTQTVTDLAPGANTTLIFTWDTTQFAFGTYTIKVDILNPPATYSLNVKVKGMGDVDGSGKVEWGDLGLLGLAYGSTPGALNWNPEADFDASGKVDWADLGILGLNYGRRYY